MQFVTMRKMRVVKGVVRGEVRGVVRAEAIGTSRQKAGEKYDKCEEYKSLGQKGGGYN